MPLIQPVLPTDPGVSVVRNIATLTDRQFKALIDAWEQSIRLLWQHPTVTAAETLAAMGTDAAHNFQASSLTGQFLGQLSSLVFPASVHPTHVARIQQIAALVPPCTVHPDGTVTIDG